MKTFEKDNYQKLFNNLNPLRRIIGISVILLGFITGGAAAQVQVGESGTLSGNVFGDLYLVPFHHNTDLEGSNGFWFRRIYLTYDRQLSESFSSRLRLEMANTGDFVTASNMFASVKDAWLKWSNDQHAIVAGISPTPTWGLVEEVWGYRSVEKTPVDLQGMGSSRDFGLSFTGTLGEDEQVQYHVMAGNGNGTRSETDDGKKLMLSLGYQLDDEWVVEAYGDYNSVAGGLDIYTLQAFAGYRTDRLSAGALYASQNREQALAPGSLTLNIASVFANFPLNETTRGLLRVDHMFDANPGGEGINYIPFSNDAPSTLIIGGIDLTLDEKIHLIPNLEAVVYGEDDAGNSPESDLIARITLAFTF